MEFLIVPLEEQETLINISYDTKTLSVYTTRKSVSLRLIRWLGEPHYIQKQGNKIYSVEYKYGLTAKEIIKILAVATIIGGFRREK